MGICKCPSGQYATNKNCVLLINNPGESCQSGEICGNGSVCRFGVCICEADFHIVETRCERIGIRRNASKSKKKNFQLFETVDDDLKEEVFITAPGHLCTKEEKCTGGSVCKNNYCVCVGEEVIINDKCVNGNNKTLQVFLFYF